MNDNERFEACMKLAEYAAGRHDARREAEWKVSLGFWGVPVAAIATFISKPIQLDWWVGPTLVFLYGFVWLRGVHVANESDKQMADHFWRQANDILLGLSRVPTDPPPRIRGWRWLFGFLFKWAMFFHLATSIFLIWLAYRFIG